jgi:hypothetical protein
VDGHGPCRCAIFNDQHNEIVLGVPIGVGKAVHVANALFTSKLPKRRGAIEQLGPAQSSRVGERVRRRLARYALTRTEE